MKLYYSPGACSLSPHIALLEAGLNFTLQKVDLKTKQLDGGGDFLAINGKGYVPALELDNGELLTEGPAIVQYIADQNPAAKLAPAAGTLERYRLQEWLNFISTELHKTVGALFKPMAAEAKQATLERINLRFAYVNNQLAGKPYLLGETFTVADGYLFNILSWTAWFQIDLATWPNLKAFQERVAARPQVHAALAAEGLLK